LFFLIMMQINPKKRPANSLFDQLQNLRYQKFEGCFLSCR